MRGRRLRPGSRAHGCAAPAPRRATFSASGRSLRPAGRQHHAARDALEQRDAELVLQRLDLRADGRLADVQLLRGARQVTEFGDGGKAAQLVELHGRAPGPRSKALILTNVALHHRLIGNHRQRMTDPKVRIAYTGRCCLSCRLCVAPKARTKAAHKASRRIAMKTNPPLSRTTASSAPAQARAATFFDALPANAERAGAHRARDARACEACAFGQRPATVPRRVRQLVLSPAA